MVQSDVGDGKGEEGNVEKVRSVLGTDLPESAILGALARCGNKPDAAINALLDMPESLNQGLTVKRTVTSTGARISAHVKEEVAENSNDDLKPKEEESDVKEEVSISGKDDFDSWYPCRSSKPVYVKKEKEESAKSDSSPDLDDGDFPDEPDWWLVGRSTVAAVSTCRRKKLGFNEIVYFSFPSSAVSNKIVRFLTKRSGEIGRLPLEWGKCTIPLVNSSKIKVQGRCVVEEPALQLMQEVHLYVSFYIHQSLFTEGGKSSWSLSTPSLSESTLQPLLTLLDLLNINPFKKADFTPEELDARKRKLNLQEQSEGSLPRLLHSKRGKANQLHSEQSKSEQDISESTLNKLIGAADVYNLKEMDPPTTLTCTLHPYQKQALYWMSESEKGNDEVEATKTIHPCWAAYRITDKRASAVYINIFSGEASTKFPKASQIARGGILADAMGLGKTVMTIALILGRKGRGILHEIKSCGDKDPENLTKSKEVPPRNAILTAKGGTLIVCPMALLGQWKDELETHSHPGSLQVFVQYGVDRTSNPDEISQYDVVLTTYGVLTSEYKNDPDRSIFHRVEWFRVVLDEAHTIKSSRTIGAQAAYALSSHCRWCLTGTPLQNNLEDLYSLLCFLHVEPWCNWAWWQKLIQKPYESGDERGLALIKAILRPLMLRRTKDTKDKEGRPILVLPPAEIQIIECEQSEAERDFYEALFKRSKVSSPFLSCRGDSQQYADLDKLARRFLEHNPNSTSPNQLVPTKAYVQEVVDCIRRGENTECPICLESADDPVLTPCAHRMCRECLISSWRNSSGGVCPICRQQLQRNDLITCPSDNKFRVDVENNWKESCKVSKLLQCLETLRQSHNGEKSIVFSQWTSFLDLLEIALKRKRIGYLRFDGKLSQKNRELVLREFNETKEKMVLLISLKAGGVGLNLTAASNVFLMDPWWNPAVEEQAVMRIHRIGQKRTVSDTVEERMQQVQARKQRMIEGALTDGEVRTARIEELKMLFR
ncbi:hypothetical protein Sjap_008348 [Stephania japonica]|uniref:Uncharacterized protein n=1 Tax=Stephania japonica TaxID=461633 RepID=A0AAP0PC86_9MAGN